MAMALLDDSALLCSSVSAKSMVTARRPARCRWRTGCRQAAAAGRTRRTGCRQAAATGRTRRTASRRCSVTSRPAAAALGLAGDVQADVGVEQQHMHNSQVNLPQRTGQTAAAAACPSSWPCCRQPAAVLLHGLVASQRRPVDQPTTTDCSTSCAASPFHRFNHLAAGHVFSHHHPCWAMSNSRHQLAPVHIHIAQPHRVPLTASPNSHSP